MLLFRTLDAGRLESLESEAIVLLLDFVILGEEWPLLLPVRSLDVIQPLTDDAHAFGQFPFILLELFDVHPHEGVGADISESL